jgi:hypothetical protein
MHPLTRTVLVLVVAATIACRTGTNTKPVEFAAVANDANRLRQEVTENLLWQWQNHPDSCISAIDRAEGDPKGALRALQFGQDHNRRAKQLYSIAASELPDFWNVVATASTRPTSFDEARVNINWQYEKNLTSLQNTRTWWNRGRPLAALANLLRGQQHNLEVMALYRSCYRDDRPTLFKIVDDVIGH